MNLDFESQITAAARQSSFLRDVLAMPDAVNSYNMIYNLEPLYAGDTVVVEKMTPSLTRAVSRQLVKDISFATFESLESAVVKDTFPLGRGHVLAVPLKFTPSFNSYLNRKGIKGDLFRQTIGQITHYLMGKAHRAGFDCEQVVLFEHGSGRLTESPEIYDACSTGVELCSTAVHAHLHAIPIIGQTCNMTDILTVLAEVLGDNALDVMPKLQDADHSDYDLDNAAYFSLRLVAANGKVENTLLVPNQDEFTKIPGQLWRRVLGKILNSGSAVDLVDYKKLARVTVGELRSDRIVEALRVLHDSFWNIAET